MGGTGGGPQIPVSYTAVEEAMLQLIEPTAIHGIEGVYENEEDVDDPESLVSVAGPSQPMPGSSSMLLPQCSMTVTEDSHIDHDYHMRIDESTEQVFDVELTQDFEDPAEVSLTETGRDLLLIGSLKSPEKGELAVKPQLVNRNLYRK
ncbi:uncharacterized protein LOC122264516 [Penaeus japonicus]|uniref:uncharacterized protein LOC122264516 n=1 Tax=Penaeus japonicus TaxID=27405 RepID=UPI001C712C7B|nr:uncharacterized protein LOC122264516 [Penaeus japonicus]